MLDVTRCYEAETLNRPCGRRRTRSAPAEMVSNPSKKRKLWTEQQMISAIEVVKGGMKVYSAARKYDVPRMTLQGVVHGRNPAIPKPN